MSSTCPHNTTNFGPLTAEIGLGVRGLQQISTSFASWLRYCSDVAHRRPTKLGMMFGRLLGWYSLYTFSGVFAPWRNFVRCKIHVTSKSCVLVYALLHGTPAAGVSQTWRRGIRNWITELLQRTPPIFGRAAITLASAHILVWSRFTKFLLFYAGIFGTRKL